MPTRWFGDPPGEQALDGALVRLIGDVSWLLDRLRPAAVAPGDGRVEAGAAAVVLPHRGVPGCALVIQVAEWSSSVGCWWSRGTDPGDGPLSLELSAEFPLHPDGIARAVAWLAAELRRPVLVQERSYGVARRRQWSLALDDGYELPVVRRWLPRWRSPEADAGPAPAGAAGPRPAGAWLLGAALAAAAGHLAVAVLWPSLGWSTWYASLLQALDVAAFAALLAWFAVAGGGRPARVRRPMLAGLGLATLGQALELLPRPAGLPSPADPLVEAAGWFVADRRSSLFGVAALACYLAAFLAMPGGAARPAWTRVLPAAAGLVWGIELAIGLRWLARLELVEGAEPVLTWYGVLASVVGAVALGLAVVLLLVVLDRRAGMAGRPARAGRAGAILLVLGSSVLAQSAVGFLAPLLPQALAFAVLDVAFVLAWFAGTALLTVAAAGPAARPPSTDEDRPLPTVPATG
jgi:hypothetical protein